MVEIKKSIEGTVKMPTTIEIGDPMYFEECPERKDLVYSKNFRGKKEWLGYIKLVEEYEDYEFEGSIIPITSFNFTVIFAPDRDRLEIYKSNQRLHIQKTKSTLIGVDTARYYIQIGNVSDTIDTMCDGPWGEVTEVYTKGKLEGIIVDMGLPNHMSFKGCIEELEYLFSFKFDTNQ